MSQETKTYLHHLVTQCREELPESILPSDSSMVSTESIAACSPVSIATGPFHLPRMLTKLILLAEEILDQ